MIMKVEDFDDERLDDLHLMRVGQHLAYYMQQFNPYSEFLYGPLDQDELDQLNAMLERGASKDEILLTLHEWADVALDEYAKPMEQCAIEHLAIELDWEREVSGDPEAPTGVFLTLILDDRESVTKGWAELEAKGFKSHERERVINAMQGYWLIKMAANGLARSTKFETLAELDQAFNDLEEEYSQWLDR